MHYFVFSNSSGLIVGTGSSPDGTIPDGAIECSEGQHADISKIKVVDSKVVDLTDDEIERINLAANWVTYQRKAQELLDKTDIVCLRCYKAGVAYPADWQTYTSDLRAIVSAKSGDPTTALPLTPAYPAGT